MSIRWKIRPLVLNSRVGIGPLLLGVVLVSYYVILSICSHASHNLAYVISSDMNHHYPDNYHGYSRGGSVGNSVRGMNYGGPYGDPTNMVCVFKRLQISIDIWLIYLLWEMLTIIFFRLYFDLHLLFISRVRNI